MWGGLTFVCAILSLLYYAYYMPIQFVETKTKTCISSIHGRGLCASQPLKKGTPLGWLWSFEGKTHRFSPQGRYINHAHIGNIIVKEITLKEGDGTDAVVTRRDIYGYLSRSVAEGEELFLDYNASKHPLAK